MALALQVKFRTSDYQSTQKGRLSLCASLGRGEVTFLQYGAVWFVLETVLIMRCCCFCWAALAQHQGLFYFSYCTSSEEVGSAWEAGMRHNQDSWPQTDPKGYSRPYDIMLSIIQSWRKKKEVDVWSGGISLPKSLLHVMELSFLRDEHMPAHGKQWISSLFCFALQNKLPLSHKYQQSDTWILGTDLHLCPYTHSQSWTKLELQGENQKPFLSSSFNFNPYQEQSTINAT